jgi:hypothetical protein
LAAKKTMGWTPGQTNAESLRERPRSAVRPWRIEELGVRITIRAGALTLIIKPAIDVQSDHG